MGAWAAWANRSHPMPVPLVAGLVQGTLTAFITGLLKAIMDWLFDQLTGLAALILPPIAAAATSVTVLSQVHRIAGTPEVWLTLAVPSTVATIYAVIYTATRWNRREHR
jgi:hypothetical protein